MGLKLKSKAGNGEGYDLPEAGNQPAVIVAIIDLGTHEREFKGVSKNTPEIQIVWELTDQPKNEKENMLIGRSYSSYLSEKANLAKLIAGLSGKQFKDNEEFDLTKLLGFPCLVNIVHGTSQAGNVYARVEGASRLPKGMEKPVAKRKPVAWEIDGSDKLPEHLDWLPFIIGEPVLEVIRRSAEWKAKLAAARQDEKPVDELADDSAEEEEPF